LCFVFELVGQLGEGSLVLAGHGVPEGPFAGVDAGGGGRIPGGCGGSRGGGFRRGGGGAAAAAGGQGGQAQRGGQTQGGDLLQFHVVSPFTRCIVLYLTNREGVPSFDGDGGNRLRLTP